METKTLTQQPHGARDSEAVLFQACWRWMEGAEQQAACVTWQPTVEINEHVGCMSLDTDDVYKDGSCAANLGRLCEFVSGNLPLS